MVLVVSRPIPVIRHHRIHSGSAQAVTALSVSCERTNEGQACLPLIKTAADRRENQVTHLVYMVAPSL